MTISARRLVAGVGVLAALVSSILLGASAASATAGASAGAPAASHFSAAANAPADTGPPTISIIDVYIFSGQVSVFVTCDPGAGGDQTVTVSLTPDGDPNPADVIYSTAQVVPGTSGSTDLTFDVSGLTNGTDYVVAATATDAGSDNTTDTYGVDVTPPGADPQLGTPTVSNITRTGAEIDDDLVVAGAHGPEDLSVEYSTDPTHTATPTSVAAGTWTDQTQATTVVQPISGLTPVTTYYVRLVLTEEADATQTVTPWVEFQTTKQTATLGTPTVSDRTTASATVSVTVTAGDIAQSVTVQYGIRSNHSDAVSTLAQPVAASATPTSLGFALKDLKSSTVYHYRVVSTDNDGDAVDSNWATFTTIAAVPPAISITASKSRVDIGHQVTLTWKAARALSVTAGGAWTGAKRLTGGSQAVTLGKPGSYTFIIAAENGGGVRSAAVTVTAVRPAKHLHVSVPHSPVARGSKLSVIASGLARHERYTISIGGITVAHGVANSRGRVSRKIHVPGAVAAGRRAVTVTGSLADRVGTAWIQISRY